jgi:hypothetical protein
LKLYLNLKRKETKEMVKTKSMRWGAMAILLVIALVGGLFVTAPAQAATQAEIDQSIDDGIAWLVTQQNADGYWGTEYKVARTGLAVLKLVSRNSNNWTSK